MPIPTSLSHMLSAGVDKENPRVQDRRKYHHMSEVDKFQDMADEEVVPEKKAVQVPVVRETAVLEVKFDAFKSEVSGFM